MLICHASIIIPNRATRALLALTTWLGALLFIGCMEEEKGKKTVASVDTYFPIQIGETELRLQLALNPSEQRRGLMFRETLGQDDGMLFLFPKPDRRGFWMKNTKLIKILIPGMKMSGWNI